LNVFSSIKQLYIEMYTCSTIHSSLYYCINDSSLCTGSIITVCTPAVTVMAEHYIECQCGYRYVVIFLSCQLPSDYGVSYSTIFQRSSSCFMLLSRFMEQGMYPNIIGLTVNWIPRLLLHSVKTCLYSCDSQFYIIHNPVPVRTIFPISRTRNQSNISPVWSELCFIMPSAEDSSLSEA
jgi:hypothetical protein